MWQCPGPSSCSLTVSLTPIGIQVRLDVSQLHDACISIMIHSMYLAPNNRHLHAKTPKQFMLLLHTQPNLTQTLDHTGYSVATGPPLPNWKCVQCPRTPKIENWSNNPTQPGCS